MNRLNKILLLLIVIVFILCAAMFLDLYLEDKMAEHTVPPVKQTEPSETTVPPVPTETEPPVTVAPETVPPTTAAETEPTTEPSTEPETEPTTEPTTVPTEPEEDHTDYSIGKRIAAIALEQVGKPYEYGAEGPDSYDASGLMQYCYGQLGIHLPRSTAAQAEIGKIISYEDLMPGDAFCMWFENEDAPEFVGIYVGDGFYVAARSTGKPVSKIDVTTEYYKEHFVYGRRYY